MLTDLRNRIDRIDDELTRLFKERLTLSAEVAAVKRENGQPILSTAREREIVSRLTSGEPDGTAAYIKILYTTLFDLSRGLQAKLLYDEAPVADAIARALTDTPQLFPKAAVVACQGTEGANSTAACEKLFERPSIMYVNTFEGVFGAVAQGLCQYGILPIENSLHGSVTDIYELMKKHRFYIVRGVKLKINHVLLAKPGVKMADVKAVYSHEQALAQCGDFLKSLSVRIVPCENTAVAAQRVAEGDDPGMAAVSSPACAELYGLNVLREGIQNNGNNYTRFICISKNLEIYPGARRISLMLTLPHRPGSLYRLMAKFAALGINLTKLESRPLPDTDFEFMFYFDLDVSVYDEAVRGLFAQLQGERESFTFLGSYSEL